MMCLPCAQNVQYCTTTASHHCECKTRADFTSQGSVHAEVTQLDHKVDQPCVNAPCLHLFAMLCISSCCDEPACTERRQTHLANACYTLRCNRAYAFALQLDLYMHDCKTCSVFVVTLHTSPLTSLGNSGSTSD